MTKRGLLELRPRFNFGQTEMVDWFMITETASFFSIRSGLRHVDDEIKSPYFYEEVEFGENAEEKSLQKFDEWWEILNVKIKK